MIYIGTGIAGYCASTTLFIPWRSVIRDTLFYLFICAGVIFVLVDARVSWIEGLGLIGIYSLYIGRLLRVV